MKKQLKITIAMALFFLAAITDIYAVIAENQVVELYTKPMLLTLLAVVYLVSTKTPVFWYVFGMFCCWVGDVLLLFEGADFFTYGLASFLLGHLIYIKLTVGFLPKDLTAKMITSAVPFVLLFGALMSLIYSNLGEMLVPVVVYGITISTFGSITLLNYRTNNSVENLWLFLGALIFILSDSLIALNKFHEPHQVYGISIMLTYILAQFLICKSMIAKSTPLSNK